MGQDGAKRNYVFISYNHEDVKWAKWLQRKLEWYRLPTEARNELSSSGYIRPVFRDRDTLTAGVLNDELRNHLEASKYLVVICSPHSAQSQWVSDEVKAFIEMGRLDRIVPFIIEGSPKNYEGADFRQPLMGECFPLALRQWNSEHPERNLLGIAVTDDGKTDRQKAFIRLVSHLLGIDFDTLWQRHKRYVRRLIAALSVFVVIALLLIYWFMIPVKVNVTLKDEPSRLPGMERGTLTALGSEYSFVKPDTTITLSSLPGYYRLKRVPVSFHAERFYTDETEMLHVGMGISQDVTIQLHRDSTFAVFAGRVYDGDDDDYASHPIAGAKVSIGRYVVETDGEGRFRIVIPLEEQEETKGIEIVKEGYLPYLREDESPSFELMYLLHRGKE